MPGSELQANDPSENRFQRAGLHGLALLVFLALAIWLTWPQAALAGQAVVGGPIAETDAWQKVWNLWWARTALERGTYVYFTTMLFWPQGVSLGFQPIDLTSAVLTAPLLFTSGPLAAYALAAILGFALSGFCTYLLGLRLSQNWIGALAAGLVVVLAPAHLVRFVDGQLEHVTLQWVPLYLLALWHATERPTWRSGVWLALTVALVSYTSWYHALFCALMTLAWLVWHSAARRTLWPLLRPWMLALPLIPLLLLPIVPSLLQGAADSRRGVEHWREQAQLYSADLVDLVLPSAHHPLWGPPIFAYQQALHPESAGWVVTPGYIALALALIGVIRCRPARVWGLLALVLYLFALGESLRIGGMETGVPLPVAWLIANLPGLGFGHRRFIAATVALVPLAAAAAYGAQVLAQHLPARFSTIMLLLVGAVWLFENAPPPMQVYRDDTSPVYATLRDRPGAILDLPLYARGLDVRSATLRSQMTHGRPQLAGYVARDPEYPLGLGGPLIGQVSRQGCTPAGVVPDDPQIVADAFAYYEITAVVLHPERIAREQQRDCVRETLEANGFVADQQAGNVTVFSVPPGTPRPFLFLGTGWLTLERDGTRAWRWMTDAGRLYLVNTHAEPRVVGVRLRVQSFAQPRLVEVWLNGRFSGRMQVDAVPGRVYTVLIPARPGENEIELRSATERDPGPEGERAISILLEWAEIR